MITKLIHFSTEKITATLNERDVIEKLLSVNEFKEIEFRNYDIDSEEAQPLMIEYRIKGVPSTVFIDEKGDFIRKITGMAPEKDYITYLKYDMANGK